MEKPTCRHLDGCGRPARKLGWCSMHYNRVRTTGSPGPAEKLTRWGEGPRPCNIAGCEKNARHASGVCDVHYHRIRKSGDPGVPGLMRRPYSPEIREYTPSQRHRWFKYGLTPAAFEAMLTAQGHRCYVCSTQDPGGKGWSVDHCHETKAVRFIACNPCNAALGLIKEDPRIAKRLYEVALECQQLRLPI